MRISKICLITFTILLLFAGCEQLSQPEEMRELDRYDQEPEIEVVMEGGETATMSFEEYIQGVVAGEMKPDWPLEAYGAQAILARSFALRYMEDNNTRMISGAHQFAQEYNPDEINEQIVEGVSLSRGEAIVNDDRFIHGWFHASAGGETTTAQVGIGYERPEPPYTKTVQSPDQEAPEDVQNWEVSFSSTAIQDAVSELGYEVGTVEEVEIINTDRTGRVISFRIKGSQDTAEIHGADFRNELGSQELKSTMISDIDKREDELIFSGSGYGHGVGMSQWGAYSLANEGKTPEEIVEFYFENIELVKVYD